MLINDNLVLKQTRTALVSMLVGFGVILLGFDLVRDIPLHINDIGYLIGVGFMFVMSVFVVWYGFDLDRRYSTYLDKYLDSSLDYVGEIYLSPVLNGAAFNLKALSLFLTFTTLFRFASLIVVPLLPKYVLVLGLVLVVLGLVLGLYFVRLASKVKQSVEVSYRHTLLGCTEAYK